LIFKSTLKGVDSYPLVDDFMFELKKVSLGIFAEILDEIRYVYIAFVANRIPPQYSDILVEGKNQEKHLVNLLRVSSLEMIDEPSEESLAHVARDLHFYMREGSVFWEPTLIAVILEKHYDGDEFRKARHTLFVILDSTIKCNRQVDSALES